jgi:hypothetical protein
MFRENLSLVLTTLNEDIRLDGFKSLQSVPNW